MNSQQNPHLLQFSDFVYQKYYVHLQPPVRRVFLASKYTTVRHFGTSADVSGQFGTGAKVSYGHFGTSAKMSWVRSVMGPECLDTLLHLLSVHYSNDDSNDVDVWLQMADF